MESMTKNVLDFNKICRTCLSTDNLIPICGLLHSNLTSIEFVLIKYANIKFDPTDKLPKQICCRCFKKLNTAYIFLKNCEFINSSLIDCLTRFESSLQPNRANTLEIIKNEIKEEPQEVDNSNLEEFQMNYENKVSMTEIAHLENIKVEPQVSIEIFNEQYNPADENECQEIIPLIDYQNEVQVISDDSNSGASTVGLKTTLENSNTWTRRKKASKKKCILCEKKLFKTYSTKQNDHCECKIKQCDICHKYFRNSIYLSRHLLTHNTS